MAIDLHSSNLPSGSYDDIFIKCGEKENKCDNLINTIKCFCNNFVTENKIKFITRKKNWDDAVFELTTNNYTSN